MHQEHFKLREALFSLTFISTIFMITPDTLCHLSAKGSFFEKICTDYAEAYSHT